jgi:F0F1-type ATP synthase epsilon subunit
MCGFWLPIWILSSIRIGGWRCQSCGNRGPLSGRILTPVVCIVLFFVAMSTYIVDNDPDDSNSAIQTIAAESSPIAPTTTPNDITEGLAASDDNSSNTVDSDVGRTVASKASSAPLDQIAEPTPKQDSEPENDSTSSNTYAEGETVNVAYTSYSVWYSWWSSQLSDNEFLDEPADAHYLFIELTVRNDDTEPRMVPPFKLIDEYGSEYETSANAWAVEGSIGILRTLNPSVSKQGFIVFDVPRDRSYRLKLSGGFWSTKDAFVEINPAASRQAAIYAKEAHAAELKANMEAALERLEQMSEESRRKRVDAAKWRTWSDLTGKFKTEAKYGGIANGKVKLTNNDGKVIQVPIEKLSTEDQKWIEDKPWLEIK